MKHPFEYEIIYSRRRTAAIQVTSDGKVLVRAPFRCPRSFIDSFLLQKEDWVLKHLEQAEKNRGKCPDPERPPLSEAERARYIKIARDIFTRKTEYYARLMGVTYGRISIREQKTRWGSCSAQGNLNFHWKLILMPPAILDYVVVHELAHRIEMNHSPRFWTQVERILPDYRERRRWLKENGGLI